MLYVVVGRICDVDTAGKSGQCGCVEKESECGRCVDCAAAKERTAEIVRSVNIEGYRIYTRPQNQPQ